MWVERDAEEVRIVVGHMSGNGTSILKHPEAAGLHDMWSALRGTRSAPFRAELDAGKIGAKAPFLAIFEHVGPSNFRIRIAGDRLNRWFGLELRGMSVLAMLDAGSRNHGQAVLNRVVADPSIGVLRGEARALDGQAVRFEMVMLPMRSDFGRIDRVLAGIWLLDPPATVSYPFLLAVEEAQVHEIDPQTVLRPEPAGVPKPAPAAAPPRPALRAAEPAPVQTAAARTSAVPAPAAPAEGDAAPRPTLRAIDGSPTGGAPARRGHLRLVKNT